MEKFIKALKLVKVEGRWSLGLIVGDSNKIDSNAFPKQVEQIIINEIETPLLVVDRVSEAFTNNKWVILVVGQNLSSEVYALIKSLSVSNRFVSINGAENNMPDTVRLVVVVETDNLKLIERLYPDFRFLFGPVIEL